MMDIIANWNCSLLLYADPGSGALLLQLLIASGITDPAAMQAEFDRR